LKAERLPAPKQKFYLLLVLLFCLTWSSAFPAAKLAISVGPPLLFLGIRFSIAAVLLLGFAAATGRLRAVAGSPIPWLSLMALGVINQAGYQGLAWMGMRSVSGGLATIVASLNPVLVSVLAVPLLGERMTWRKLAGLVLGFLGAAFVVRNRIIVTGEDPFGIGLIAIGMVAMTLGTLLYKRFAPKVDLFVAVGAQQVGAGLALLVAGSALGERMSEFVPGPLLWGTMLWFIVVISIGAFLLWFRLLRQGTASAASSLHFLMPPLGLLMSWAALGETLHPLDLLGIVPVALGIRLATTVPVSRKPRQA
jgi:drug/metabolite transporter (DMT)-like permease